MSLTASDTTISQAVTFVGMRIKDYCRWEGDWEFICGIPLAMSPSPGISHQRVARRLLRQFNAALDDCPG